MTQFAKSSSREYYEKGKYDWNDKTHILSLLPNKPEAIKRKFDIKDDVTLILLGENAKPIIGNQDNYTLRRSDKAKSRDVHIH